MTTLIDEQIETMWRYVMKTSGEKTVVVRFARAIEAAISAAPGGPTTLSVKPAEQTSLGAEAKAKLVAAVGWGCKKCGTDRTKAACPLGHSAALTGQCPMSATAQGVALLAAKSGETLTPYRAIEAATVAGVRQTMTTLTDEQIETMWRYVMKTSGEKTVVVRFARAIEAAVSADMQARIDELMLEYCPSEMAPQQRANWAAHQNAAPEPAPSIADEWARLSQDEGKAEREIERLNVAISKLKMDAIDRATEIVRLRAILAATPGGQ